MNPEEKKMLEEVHSVLIGNREMGEMGIAKKVDAMWTVFSGLTLFGRVATWIAVILAGVGAVWSTIVHFVQNRIK